ncbi:FK506-binding protein 2-like [Mytilus edulis]|uniref:FK506-binding protein 2-like n=1 Tax=Mytilus edulis TaxID=6550 RepID=UPI0039EEFC8C
MNCLQFTLALLLFSFSVSNGQFQKMFGQQTVLDGHPGASDGKILIKSELDIKTTYLPEDCTIVTKTGDTITLEYDAYVNDEHKETSKETEGMPAGLLEFTIGKRMVVLGLDIGVVGMCTGEKRSIKIPPQLAWGEKGIPGIIPANAMARFDIELVKIQGQSWADWYVEILQIVCGICFAAGAIALGCEKIREKKGGKKSK